MYVIGTWPISPLRVESTLVLSRSTCEVWVHECTLTLGTFAGYGGHQLGPKRFSIINTVARDAFVKGGFVQEDGAASKKKGKR